MKIENFRIRISHFALFIFQFIIFNLQFTIGSLYAATISSDRIGYVDMDRILKEFPETGKIRGELLTEVTRQKEYITLKQKEIDTIKMEIRKMEEEIAAMVSEISLAQDSVTLSTSATHKVSPSTSALPGFTFPPLPSTAATTLFVSTPTIGADAVQRERLEASRKEKEEQLIIKRELAAQKEKLLTEFKITSEKEITDLDSKAARNIYGRIYDAIKFVADASALTVVLDGANVIYGEKGEEITERVIQRLFKLQIQGSR